MQPGHRCTDVPPALAEWICATVTGSWVGSSQPTQKTRTGCSGRFS